MSTQLPKSIHWVLNQCDDAVKDGMRAYWTKKWPRIEKLLAPFPLEVQDVRLTVTCHRPADLKAWYDFHAVLKLPIGTLVADASGKEPGALIDHAINTLVGEVKRRKERGSKSFVTKRKNRSHADLSAAGPQPNRGLEHRHEFLQSFRPLLPLLGARARHELRALEAKGLLHRGELTVQDLLDEVLTRAWQKYDDRPRGVSLETWFTELLHSAIEAWIRQEPHPYRSVDQPVRVEVPTDEQPQVDDQQWWEWLLGYRDSSTLADLLPARESFDISSAAADSEDAPADAASLDEAEPAQMAGDPLATADDRHRVWLLLRELPTLERQALILNVLDGLAPHEIAILQDRPESEVRGDIEAARATLREGLLAGAAASDGGPSPQATRSAAPAAGAAPAAAKPVAAAAGRKK